MGLLVVHPGPSATVQDLGRVGFRAWGVPVGGAFDRDSFGLANALLGNPPGAAAVEFTLFGGTFEARIPLALALVGAPMQARVIGANGTSWALTIPQTLSLRPGDRLVLSGCARGARTYLAVRGGWRTPLVLGSRSSEEPLRAGDLLPAEPGVTPVRRPAGWSLPDPLAGPLRILDGPDANRDFDPTVWEDRTFRIRSDSDRMGLRLEGPPLEVKPDPDRLSTPVAPGSVQVAGGRAIILGVACGTMGGYPLVAHLLSADLARLAQARSGDPIRLHRVELAEAHQIDRDSRLSLARRDLLTAALAADRAAVLLDPNLSSSQTII